VYGERARDGGFALGDLSSLENRPHHINQDFEGVVERDLLAPSVTWKHFGDSVEFTSITAFQDWDVLETADFDFSPIDGVRRRTVEEQEYFYEELRFSSTEESELAVADQAAIHWVAGLSVFSADSRRAVDNEFRPGGAGILFPPMNVGVDGNTGNFDDLGLGVFGQATLTLHEDLDFTAGLRYDYESKDADLHQTFEVGGFPVLNVRREFDEEYDDLVPSFSLAWRAAEDLTTYASAAKGFKAGGFNLNAPSGQFSFGPETSWTYELGVKKAWFEERVHAALALFFVDWEDMQLSLFDPSIGGYVDNAGASTSRGVELEADWEVDEHLTLFSGFGYTDTEIDEFVDQFGNDTSGNELPFAPETMWNLGAEYAGALARGMSWYVRGDYVNVGDFAYEPGNNETESYELANFRIGLRRDGWDASLWARNAFDEEYVPIAFQINPADPTQFVGENGAPATWGITLRGSF
jgi:iron complex outermembrane receptor protein